MDDHDEHKEAHEKLVELARDRDEWKRRAEASVAPETLRKWGLNPEAVREYDSLEDAMYAMGYVLDRCYERGPGIGHVSEPMCTVAERDEWKRRAEAAEAELVDPRRTIRVATDGDLVELGSVHDCGRLELVVTRRDNEVLPGRHFLAEQVMRESGPGIAATKPADDGHYIDPLDLLAADA